MKRLHSLVAACLALSMALMLCMLPAASASYTSSGYVYLLDDGGTAVSDDTDWRFKVDLPDGYGLDAAANFTVTAYCENESAAGAAYTVTAYLYDGTTNVTSSVEITTSNSTTATGTISISATSMASLTETESGNLYITLTNATTTVDTYDNSVIRISATATGGAILDATNAVAGALIAVAILGMVVKGCKGWR